MNPDAPLRPLVRAAVSPLRLTGRLPAGFSGEDGTVLIGPRIGWAAGLLEFEQVELSLAGQSRRVPAVVRFGREGEVILVGLAEATVETGDILSLRAIAWVAGEPAAHTAALVQCDDANLVIEIRRVPARAAKLDPASFPLPPVIEFVQTVGQT